MSKTKKVENLFLKRKDKRYYKKKWLKKKGYDTDYKVSKIQTFISKFKEKNKRKRKQNKRTRRRNKKLETLINKSKCLKWIVKDILPKYRKRKIYNQK